MSARRRKQHQLAVQLKNTRKRIWRRIQQAHSKGLVFDPISGRTVPRPAGWWPKARYKVRLQIASYLSRHPGATALDWTHTEVQQKE